MALSNAERQKAYRERHRKPAQTEAVADPKALRDALNVANQRIRAQDEEIRHLKRELASRPALPLSIHQFGSPKPAPKPSRSTTSGRGRGI